MIFEEIYRQDIEKFIDQFRAYEKEGVLEDTFLCGQCYWFAFMLQGRFKELDIVYEPVECHFLAQGHGRLYDIRGDVTELYMDEPHEFYAEEVFLEIRSVVEGCILKIS